MIKKLQENGLNITYEEVLEAAKPGLISRGHIAKIIWKNNRDKFKDYEEIFSEYLKPGKKAYTKREFEISFETAIKAIKGAGGLAILSHPCIYSYDAETLIKAFVKAGGDGIETFYAYHLNKPSLKLNEQKNKDLMYKMREIAKRFN